MNNHIGNIDHAYNKRKNDIMMSKEAEMLTNALTNPLHSILTLQTWHSNEHFSIRDIMQHCIIHLIKLLLQNI